MRQIKTWVIVANSQTARLFDFTGRHGPLVPLDDHIWHAPEINEDADKQGVTHSSVGHSQHKLASHTGPDKKADAFAREIAEKLSAAHKSGAFKKLIIVAAPKLMGLLRERMDDNLRATIQSEIDKDLVHLPLDKIDSALKREIFG